MEETGTTFAANAALKARFYARRSGLPTLADDSGLEVDALGGGPGVRTRRYAGEQATDAQNNTKLLAALAGLPPERRGARYRCVLALALPERAAVALSTAAHEIKLRELVKSSADIVAVIDAPGREQAHRIGMNLKGARVAIEKVGKTAREDATAFSKAIIAEEKRLIAISEPEDTCKTEKICRCQPVLTTSATRLTTVS